MRPNRKKGFTITELVIVIAVIAVLAAVLIPTFASVVSSANESKAMQNCHNALTSYRADNDHVDVDPGMVLINNEDNNMYAYVYLGGNLQKIDKMDKIIELTGNNDKLSKQSNKKITFEGNHETGKKIEYTITTVTGKDEEEKEITEEEGGTIIMGKVVDGEEEKDAKSTSVINTIGKEDHNELNIYFYSVEFNDKTYYGWFTIEVDIDNALLSLEEGKVVYSNDFGYIEAEGNSTVVFKDYEEPKAPEGQDKTGEAGADAGNTAA